MLSVSCSDDSVDEAREAIAAVNARIPRQHRLSMALSHGPSLFTVAGAAEGVMLLLSEAESIRGAHLTPLPVAPFHTIHNSPALELVAGWGRGRELNGVRPEHLQRAAYFGSPLNGQTLTAGTDQLTDAVHFHIMYEPVAWGDTLRALADEPTSAGGTFTCCLAAGHGGLLGINSATFQRLPLEGPSRLFSCRLPLFADAAAPATAASAQRRVASAAVVVSQADLDAVQSALLDVIGREVPPDTPFLSAGVSSRDMVRIAERLQEASGRSLPPTVLFDYPTVSALARFLGAPQDLPLVLAASHALASRMEAAGPADTDLVVIAAVASTLPADPTSLALASAAGPRLGDRIRRSTVLAASFQDAQRLLGQGGARPAAVPPFCGAVPDPSAFDSDLFHLPGDESRYMDPQQRMLLEHVVAATAASASASTAAAAAAAFGGASSLCDVYAGISWNDYASACKDSGLPHKVHTEAVAVDWILQTCCSLFSEPVE